MGAKKVRPLLGDRILSELHCRLVLLSNEPLYMRIADIVVRIYLLMICSGPKNEEGVNEGGPKKFA